MIKRYKVGGCVRDQILGVRSKDIDYSVTAPDYASMRQYIIDLGGKIFVEQEQYLTIRAHLNGEAADFVLARKDGTYHLDGRRPDFVEPGTIYDDLARRDFTMNAIAIDEDGSYLDPHNGKKDIESRTIRCVGNAHDRFSEDALRMLRAIRFRITKKMFLDREIVECFYDELLLNKLKNVSLERMSDELKKCFEFDTPTTLQFFDYDGCEDLGMLRNAIFNARNKSGQRLILVPKITEG